MVERSADGTHFLAIGEVLAKGNASTLNSYSFVDKRPLNGYNYYRLKQVDLNNDFDHSKIEVVKNDLNELNISIFPNPASSYVQVSGLEANKTHSYILLNVLGQKMASGKISNGKIDLPTLPKAVYTLQVLEESRNMINHKLIIR